jgi:hypothetical protein
VEAVAAAATPVPTGRQTVLVAIAQGSLMALGAVLALLVAHFFGKNAETDAFFAAHGLYGVGVTLASTFRLTAVSRLVRSPGPATATRLLGAVLLVALVAAVPMVVLAGPLGGLLVDHDPSHVAPDTLRYLWVALTGQLVGAMLATILTVRGHFSAVGLAILLTGFVSIGVFAVFHASVGIPAAGIGLAVTAILLALSLGATLVRSGWRPALPGPHRIRDVGAEAGRLSFASATFFAASFAYVACVAVAARQGGGDATLFAYAFMLATVLIGVTSNVTAMVRSPSLVASDRRAEETAAAAVWSFRFSLVLIGPVLGMVLLVGGPVIGWALGAQFSGHDVREVLATVSCLSVWVVAAAASVFAIVELLAAGELARMAALSVAQVVVIVPAAAAGAAVAGTPGIAAGMSLVALAVALVQLRWAFGAIWRRTAAGMAGALGRELLVLAAAFGPATAVLLAVGGGAPGVLGAGALGAVLAVAATGIAWPGERRALIGLLAR